MKKSTRNILRIVIYGGLIAIAGMVVTVNKLLPTLDEPLVNQWAKYTAQPQESLTGHYLAGRHAAVQRDYDGALTHIRQALEKVPNDESLLAQAVQLEIMAGNIDEAVPLALRLEALGVQDELGLLVRAIDHARYGNFSATLEVLQKDIPSTLYSVVRPLMVQWAAIATNPPTVGVSLRGEARKSGLLAPFIYYQEALMNDVLGFDEAVREGFSSVAENPEHLPFRLMEALVNHMVRTGEMEKAQAVLDTYRTANPDSNFAKLDEMLKPNPPALVGSVRDGMAELVFTAASMLMGQEAYSEASAYLQLALALNEDHAPSLFMIASIHEAHERYGAAIAAYESIADETPYGRRGAVRIALNQQAMGEMSKAITSLKALVKQNPSLQDPLISLADLYRIDMQYDKASETYSKAIALASQPSWALYYARGITYERAKVWNKAEADFLSALSLKPDQPDVLNYLGYSLLDRGERADEAKEMISKAVQQRPYDAHIIDSMGWAHYMVGEYKEAVAYLERAAELTPHDPTINDHLGDAYWRVGREIEARYQWQRALLFKPEEKHSAAIKQKLEEGLPPIMLQKQSQASGAETADSGTLSTQ